MLKLQKVKREGFGYKFFKILASLFHNLIFYKKVSYIGRENIPKDKPVLMGPNHQNALMDASAIICSSSTNVNQTFLARSDIFGTDLQGNFLLSLKILPVYRIRDGKEKLAKNEEIFNLSVEILEKNKTLVIFPEAQHTPFRSLIQLKKGLMRIAFHTAKKNNFEIDLNILPVGIYYENYYNYRSKLLIQYGKPLKIIDYKERYEENPQAAFLSLRNDLKKAMIPLAIHIKNKKYYQVYENSRQLFDEMVAKEEKLNLKIMIDKFKADKKIIDVLDNVLETEPEKFEVFQQKVTSYFDKLKELKIKDYLFEKPVSFVGNFLTSLFWIILLPINLIGFVNFSGTICLLEVLVKKFKDQQFHSSVRFVLGLFLPIIWTIIGAGLLWIFVNVWWITLGFVLIQWPLMIAWFELRKLSKKILGKWRFLFNRSKIKQLKIQRDELLQIYKSF